jgi:hypothetical protein
MVTFANIDERGSEFVDRWRYRPLQGMPEVSTEIRCNLAIELGNKERRDALSAGKHDQAVSLLEEALRLYHDFHEIVLIPVVCVGFRKLRPRGRLSLPFPGKAGRSCRIVLDEAAPAAHSQDAATEPTAAEAA